MPEWKSEVRRRLTGLELGPERESSIVEELAQHLDDCYGELIDGGLSEAEAYQQTLAELSDGEIWQHELRQVERQIAPEPVILGTNRRSNMIADMWQDLRYGARVLRQQPGFALIIILTLALGIGATTAIFSIADSILLRPLPYRDADRLVKVLETDLQRGSHRSNRRMISLGDFLEWKQQARSFDEMAALSHVRFRRTGDAAAEDISGNEVSANFFSFLGAKAALGRTFLPEDELPTSQPVVVLSHQYWETYFGSSSSVIGRTMTLDGKAHVIVGVLPADFRQAFESFPGRAQLWTPIVMTPEKSARRGPGAYMALGRLGPGVTIEQASAEMATLADRLAQDHPKSNRGVGAAVYLLHEEVTGNTQQTLWTLLAAVGFVLLIACANVAGLLLARGVERAKEMTIRAALGAGRWRVVRQLLTESGLLALLGGALGFLLARWIVAAIVPLIPRQAPRTDEIALDHRALLFALAVSICSVFVFGLLPAMQTAAVDLTIGLKDGGHGSSEGRGRRWRRGSLIVWQVALTMILLVGAGLLANSMIRLYRTDPGIEMRNVAAMALGLPRSGNKVPQQWNNFWTTLAERAQSLPGVEDVALVQPLPLGDSMFKMNVGLPAEAHLEDRVADSEAMTPLSYNIVGGDYFRLLSIGLLRGRYFSEEDRAETPPVIVVNESLARRYFPDREAVGRTMIVNRGLKNEQTALIVGVVADSRARLDLPAEPNIFLPAAQSPSPAMYLVARTTTAPESTFGALRELVSSMDRNQPISQLTTMDTIWAGYTVRPRFYLAVLGGLAALAVFLSAIGIYGMLSHTVSRRIREIGIRRALGAQDRDVLRLVIGEGLMLALLGVIVGAGGALALSRLLRGWLYEVSATDPATFVVVAIVLLLITLAACVVPARRATRVDPLQALRYD